MNKRRHYRTLWISDIHLGSRGSRAGDLVRFLSSVRCRTLYLVGDDVDLLRLGRRLHWPAEHSEVIRQVFAHVRDGTRVIFIPGNHDRAARQFLGASFGGVELHPHHVHHTADGRRLLVTHGDQHDRFVEQSPLLGFLGGKAYDGLAALDHGHNVLRRWVGLSSWSLCRYVKSRIKSVSAYLRHFEESLAEQARSRQCDGIVCGHVHVPEIRESRTAYYNCGDWVESCSALAEHGDGRMQLLDGLEVLSRREQPSVLLAAPQVSVVIPTWNEESWLPRLLHRLQSVASFREIIVADNDSRDRTAEIARELGCRVVPGGRPGAARNRGAAVATGEILLFLDADVLIDEAVVESILEAFADSEVVALHFRLQPIGAGRFVRLCFATMTFYFALLSRLGLSQGIGGCMVIRASSFRQIRGFDEDVEVGEDADIFRRLRKIGKVRYETGKAVLASPRRFAIESPLGLALKTMMWAVLRLTGRKKSLISYKWETYPSGLAGREAQVIGRDDPARTG
jgi:UDP-2,3-diacylglucosamine pyrophosphatase LpxH